MHPLAPKQQVKLCTEIDAYSKRRTQTLSTWLKDNAPTISINYIIIISLFSHTCSQYLYTMVYEQVWLNLLVKSSISYNLQEIYQ